MEFRLCSHPRQTMAVLLLLVLLSGAQQAAAQDNGSTLSEYRALLSDTRAALKDAPPRQETVKSLALRWSAIEHVVAPDGTKLAVDHDWLVRQLQAPDPDVEAIRVKLEALETVWDRWPQREFDRSSGQEAQAQLQEILARPQFQWPQEGPTLLQRIWERLLRFLFNVFPDTLVGGRPLSALLAGLGALLLLAVLLYAGRTLFSSVSPSSERSNEAAPHPDVTADRAWREAESLSQRGDYRMAVRYLYLSALLVLDERGLIAYDRTRTNREYLRTVSHRPELASTLREVVDVFDRVWYGFRSLDQSTYSHFEARVQALRDMR